MERAGNAEAGGGSITAFYTVLSEGDDQQDPIWRQDKPVAEADSLASLQDLLN